MLKPSLNLLRMLFCQPRTIKLDPTWMFKKSFFFFTKTSDESKIFCNICISVYVLPFFLQSFFRGKNFKRWRIRRNKRKTDLDTKSGVWKILKITKIFFNARYELVSTYSVQPLRFFEFIKAFFVLSLEKHFSCIIRIVILLYASKNF